MKNILKFFEYFMDETSNKIGDSSTEELTVTRIKNGFRLFANNFVIEIKDNPVPSIDNYKKIVAYINNFDTIEQIDKVLIEDYIKKLQNGVETNKEQPIKAKCSCKKPHYGFKTIAVCTDCNGIKDDEYWKKIRLMR
jgi:hypothetical protein